MHQVTDARSVMWGQGPLILYPVSGVQWGPMFAVQHSQTPLMQMHVRSPYIQYQKVGGTQPNQKDIGTPYIQYQAVGVIQPSPVHFGTPYTQYQANDIQHGDVPHMGDELYGDCRGGQQFQEGTDNSKQNHAQCRRNGLNNTISSDRQEILVSSTEHQQLTSSSASYEVGADRDLDVLTENRLNDSKLDMYDVTDSFLPITNRNDTIESTDNFATKCGSNTLFGQGTDNDEKNGA
ncbi:uncharacterized protein LOC119073035 [Bradysia coprophila]|uniref:uncharacterized protein LOC119073035 n=1 Tax=Bradysia coprophila TaxID=38358 RepID=UPI00187DC403|nr:uncharacterized protein LOC119073035 [Bradysia coprophila]